MRSPTLSRNATKEFDPNRRQQALRLLDQKRRLYLQLRRLLHGLLLWQA
jgi:hypothetical protein